MVGDRHPRLDQAHDFAKSFGRGVDLGTDLKCCFGGQPIPRHEVRNGDEALVDYEVRAFCVFNKPLVWVGIAGEDEIQSVPLELVADRTIDRVDSGKGDYLDAVLIIDHLLFLIAEFGDFGGKPANVRLT